MPDFYNMHVALCREKHTPKHTPLRDAAWPIATLALSALALVASWPTHAPGERRLERLKCDKISQFCDRTHYDVTLLGPDITLRHTPIHSLIHSPKFTAQEAPTGVPNPLIGWCPSRP